MKQIYFLLLLGAVACSRQPADHFVLRGIVPGAMDSTQVMLKTLNGRGMQKFTGYIIDEKFELRGKLDVPTHCRLNLDNYDYIKSIGGDPESSRTCNIDLFVENGELTFTTPHFDSLPQAFWRYDIRKEKNYRLEGSPAQDAYYRYQQQTIPLRYDLYELRGKENLTLDENRQINAMMEQLHEIGKAFIRNNSNLAANLYVAETVKKSPFTYNRAYLDEMEQLFASYQDTCAGLKDFRQYLHEAVRFVQGAPLQDGELTDMNGKNVSLLAQLSSEGYTIIDFWASWCGPCRASFPHLREMYERYGKDVRFVSISIDQKKEDWQRAVGEEKLPWTQLLSTPALNKALPQLYDLRGVPTFLLVNPEGKIVFSGHGSGELEIQLDAIQ
ncbi:TlpA disulfide reductase family protein [Odoribacter sp. Z80]|uniref:TlpA disulfide reductase family protein n=1 Tax=Odoribacter sp. Z80 TaxID=2304575 RepID=UPI00137B406D|nr:TlpA disulfide reductase family protein [Odoribacter sp. Z80]NCE72743.1 AhpC/TSA family protein [Odoribacter sp. Z80]